MEPNEALWRALADPTRRAILDELRKGPRTTGQLCVPFPLSRYAIMKHLRILVDANLVLVRRRGRQRWNYLNAVPLRRLYERWVRRFEGQWAASLSRLKDQSEGPKGAPTMAGLEHPVTIEARNVEQEISIAAPPEKVFEAITTSIGKWWAFKSRPTMKLEPWPGGRFFEEEENGDGFLWGTVIEVRRPHVLRVSELLGSLDSVRAGAHKYELEPTGEGTLLKLSCQVLGEVDEEARACLESGWHELLNTHLRNWVEKGEEVTQ